MTPPPKLWNLRDRHRIKLPRNAIYCGRGTPYGNPFIAGTHGSRDRVCDRFEAEVLPDLDVSALAGCDLLCWCAPLRCHCDGIILKANYPDDYRLWNLRGRDVLAQRMPRGLEGGPTGELLLPHQSAVRGMHDQSLLVPRVRLER